MSANYEINKNEAITRMNLLQLSPAAISLFSDKGLPCIFEPPFGNFIPGDFDLENLELIRRFESDCCATVYAVVRSYTSWGMVDDYLFVGNCADDWGDERKCFTCRDDGIMTYGFNHNDAKLSKMRRIGIANTANAGLRRVW